MIKNEKNKKAAKIILVLLILAAVCTIGYYNYMDYFYNMPFVIKQDSFVFEYGETVSNDINDYIDITNDKKFHKEEIIFDNTADNMKVGTYDCYAKWRKTGVGFKITIEDTQSPIITLKEEKIEIKYEEEYNLHDNIESVIDVVDGEMEYEIIGELKNTEPGEQAFTVIAKDANGNETMEEFIVNVGKKPWPKEYSDETCKITITREWFENAWCYIAHLQFTDYSRFGTSCANGAYGKGKELIESAHERLGSILTVNGCYSAPYLNYPVARSGKVRNDKACTVPAVYSSSNGKLISAWETGGVPEIKGHSLSSLVNNGMVSDTFCFGPPILQNGEMTVGSGGGRAQRTFIGTNGNPGDIWLVVSDGREIDGESSGLTYTQCARLLLSKGCTFGVPLDGGGSSSMVFQGEVLNQTSGRAIVDFVYFK